MMKSWQKSSMDTGDIRNKLGDRDGANGIRTHVIEGLCDELDVRHQELKDARNLIAEARTALIASDAHAEHCKTCSDCEAALLWCPEWYRLLEEGEKLRAAAVKRIDEANTWKP
jgi:hypothetical protein